MVAHGDILNRNLNFITSEPTFDQVSLNSAVSKHSNNGM